MNGMNLYFVCPNKPQARPITMRSPTLEPYQHGHEARGVEADGQADFGAVGARVRELHVALVGEQGPGVAFDGFPRDATARCCCLIFLAFLAFLVELRVSGVPFHGDSARREHPFALAACGLVIHLEMV